MSLFFKSYNGEINLQNTGIALNHLTKKHAMKAKINRFDNVNDLQFLETGSPYYLTNENLKFFRRR
jgi:hypothetical protein